MEKSFDILVTFHAKGTSKKIKIMIFQVVEEICSNLESSIIETLTFSLNSSTTVELLNSILIGGFVNLLDEVAMEKLFSLLEGPVLTAEETGKLLQFSCEVGTRHHCVMSPSQISGINKLMITWLQTTQISSQSSSQIFNRSDSNLISEVDGSPAAETFTVLTLASTFSKCQIMNVQVFSVVRKWLAQSTPGSELQVVRDYVTIVVEQCFRPAHKEHDSSLQKAVLCEVLDILKQLVHLDPNQAPQLLQLVKRIQSNITEKFKSDHRDISILVKVLDFLLNFGTVTGYNPQHFCTNFFKDIVYRSYSSELAAFDIVTFILDYMSNESASQQQHQLIVKYFPNLLKLIACHPTSLVEEFIELIPFFVTPSTTVEVFHSLIDLPVLSATLCLHQAPAVLQLDQTANSTGPRWLSLLENVRSPEYRSVFNFIIRMESEKEYTFDRLGKYMDLVKELSSYPLVVTCSQIVPLLLDAFFRKVESNPDPQVVGILVPAMLHRLKFVFSVPEYSDVVFRNILQHFRIILKLCPELIFTAEKELIEFISVLDNSHKFTHLYMHTVWAIGEYASPTYSAICSHEHVVKYYEALECVVYETLTVFTTQENITVFKLLNISCATLAKLASRCQDLIPRVMLCLRKVGAHVSADLPNANKTDKKIVYDRVEELVSLLKNP
ncbi:hypothetical protein L9F63_005254, partial [Diploptera punctata]